jgi:glyoxylase-like metal-dependent hydrolase (beta-lactamase superfamily II)
MTIGGYRVHAIETGRFGLDGGAMFGVVPKVLWERSDPADQRNRIDMAARALLLVGNGRVILVDTGNGDKMPEKLREIYKIETGGPTLRSSLDVLGIRPGDVTDVILTHLHFDHAGGATVREGGRLTPAFPNARYYVQREHWEAALSPTERDQASFFRDDFLPLHEQGVLHFTDGDGEILPGISVEVFYGHTTALQCPVISDGKDTLIYCADLVPLSAHVQLPWIMAYDLRPLVTLEEKRRTLARAAAERWVLFLEHDPRVAAARIAHGEKGYVVQERVTLD